MQFIFHKNAGDEQIVVRSDSYQHIFKSRRSKQKQFFVRNLSDDILYTYERLEVNRHEAFLKLITSEVKACKPVYPLHLILAIIDMRQVEKVLPMLNELGLGKITFFKSERTQHQFKVDIQRCDRILIGSCEQCGRTDKMQIEIHEDIHTILQSYPDALLFDFGGQTLGSIKRKNPCVIVGPEGGFTSTEKAHFKDLECISTAEMVILRSETAAVYLQANASSLFL